MKKEIGKPVFIAILVIVLIIIGWIGWNSMETPENRGLNEEAIFRSVEKKAKSNGVDLRTIPQWSALYYKYHPNEKPPAAASASGTPAVGALPGTSPGPVTPPAPQAASPR